MHSRVTDKRVTVAEYAKYSVGESNCCTVPGVSPMNYMNKLHSKFMFNLFSKLY